MRSTQIYNEYLYEGLNQSSRRSMRLWEGAAIQLKEAALTPDQIQQIFTSVEQGATAGGANRTFIGQGKDAASAVNKAWEDLKTKVQDSAPIKNVDVQYDSAVSKIEAGLGGPDNAVNQVIQKYRAFAKAHPVAQSLIYAALIAAAGISGAGLGGAAVLGLLKMTDKLLQGEKFSSAAYSGAKTGATAYAAGQIGQAMKGGDTAAGTDVAGQAVASTTGNPPAGMNPSFYTQWFINKYAQDPSNPSAMIIQQAKQFARTKAKVSESFNLSESQIATLFTLVQIKNRQFNEGMWDTIKNKAATVGKNLTTKVTADKLNTAWAKSGSPTDSDAVAQILQGAGVDPAVVSKAYTDLSIPAPASKVEPTLDQPAAASAINTKEMLAQIMKLTPAEQQQVLAYLKK